MREPFRRARTYLTALLWCEVVIGVLIIFVTSIFNHILSSYLNEKGHQSLTGQFFNMYMLGVEIIVIYFVSIVLWNHLWWRRCTYNVRIILHMWMFFTLLIVLCAFGTLWALFACADQNVEMAEVSLLRGIDLYYTQPEWKLLWDGLQYHKECCGVSSYEDWVHAAWMPVMPDDTDGDCTTITLAPYACCKHDCTACFENYIPHSVGTNMPALNISQINTQGCLPLYAHSLWVGLYILLALIISALKVDLMLFVFTKYILSQQNVLVCATESLDMTDEEGRPLVIVKCPHNVRCVTVDEDVCSCGRCEGGEDRDGIEEHPNLDNETSRPEDVQRKEREQKKHRRKRPASSCHPSRSFANVISGSGILH